MRKEYPYLFIEQGMLIFEEENSLREGMNVKTKPDRSVLALLGPHLLLL